jgi:hypothetical protein
MDEYVMKQKIQKACFEPRAPERLIQQVIIRAKAVVMGLEAQKQLETAQSENIAKLASLAVIGQLAAVSELPKGTQAKQLAHQLERQPAFITALGSGNVAQRLNSGELLLQITGQKTAPAQTTPENTIPKKEGPAMG